MVPLRYYVVVNCANMRVWRLWTMWPVVWVLTGSWSLPKSQPRTSAAINRLSERAVHVTCLPQQSLRVSGSRNAISIYRSAPILAFRAHDIERKRSIIKASSSSGYLAMRFVTPPSKKQHKNYRPRVRMSFVYISMKDNSQLKTAKESQQMNLHGTKKIENGHRNHNSYTIPVKKYGNAKIVLASERQWIFDSVCCLRT